MVTMLRVGRSKDPDAISDGCKRIYSSPIASLLAQGPNMPFIQRVLRSLSPGHKAGHPSSASVKNAWSCTSIPRMSSWYVAYLSTGTTFSYIQLGCDRFLPSFSNPSFTNHPAMF